MKIRVLVWVIALGITNLQADEGLKDQTKPQVAATDTSFLTEAAKRGQTEVRIAELASRQAGSDAVKRLGDKLMVEHSRINEELKALATQKAINIWGDPDNIRISELRQLTAEAFDRAYLAEVVKHHELAVADFEEASRTSSDPQVKAFVAKNLPALRSHLAAVKRLWTPEAVAPAKAAVGQ